MGVLHTPYCIRPIAYAKETLSTGACSMGVLHTPPCIRSKTHVVWAYCIRPIAYALCIRPTNYLLKLQRINHIINRILLCFVHIRAIYTVKIITYFNNFHQGTHGRLFVRNLITD